MSESTSLTETLAQAQARVRACETERDRKTQERDLAQAALAKAEHALQMGIQALAGEDDPERVDTTSLRIAKERANDVYASRETRLAAAQEALGEAQSAEKQARLAVTQAEYEAAQEVLRGAAETLLLRYDEFTQLDTAVVALGGRRYTHLIAAGARAQFETWLLNAAGLRSAEAQATHDQREAQRAEAQAVRERDARARQQLELDRQARYEQAQADRRRGVRRQQEWTPGSPAQTEAQAHVNAGLVTAE